MIGPKKTQSDQEYKTWIKKTVKRFQEDETECWPAMSSPKQQDMITFWEYHRPKMYADLKSQGLLKETAYVLECKMMEERDALNAAGMNSSDAKLQAEQDWMIMDPEDWDEPEEPEDPESPTEY